VDHLDESLVRPDGAKIRALRLKLGLSQSGLADAAQVSKDTIWRWENGYPAQRTYLRELAKILNQELESLLASQQLAPSSLPADPIDIVHPYILHADFTGRASERSQLCRWFDNPNRPICVLEAIGGMGKSALAWVWTNQDVIGVPLLDNLVAPAVPTPLFCRPSRVLWWSFYETSASFSTFLPYAVRFAGAEPTQSDTNNLRELIRCLTRNQYLIIMDGFERELRAYASAQAPYQGDDVERTLHYHNRDCVSIHAADFLVRVASAPGMKSRILITTRMLPRPLDDLAGCLRLHLTSLHPEDAVMFLKSQGIRGTHTELESAAKAYGYHPLALRLLAGYLKTHPSKPRDIVLAEAYGGDVAGKAHKHILETSYDALEPARRELLSAIACCRGAVDYETIALFNTFGGDEPFGIALNDLVDRGLIGRDDTSVLYDMHPVVRQYAYQRLGDKAHYHLKVAEHIAKMPLPPESAIHTVEGLSSLIELFHHTVRSWHYDEALRLFQGRLHRPLYLRFGAYETCIELLSALFSDKERRSWRIQDPQLQAWVSTELALCYSRSGQSKRAIPLFSAALKLNETAGLHEATRAALVHIAEAHFHIGQFANVTAALQRLIDISDEPCSDIHRAMGHQYFGRLLAYEGAYDASKDALDIAQSIFEKKDPPALGMVCAFRAVRALWMGDSAGGQQAAASARRIAGEVGSERDIVRALWLEGAAAVGMGQLDAAERDLSEALARCRKINLLALEPVILLEFARMRRQVSQRIEAVALVNEALTTADRCGYRLNQAELHHLLAQLAIDAGDYESGRTEGEKALEYARCDGHPHCYMRIMVESSALLKELPGPPPARR
jgi:tetratricopeptide (TPR) repeat protein/transcriptional regulator with XRE-family HTH domain